MLEGIANAILIVNPQAGRARRLPEGAIERVRHILSSQGIATELAVVEAPGQAEQISRDAVRNRAQLVIVCGGDGTLNGVINGLARSQVPLALLPGGTANVLAKELRIPWNIERAAERIRGGTLRRIALGRHTTFEGGIAQQRYFLSVAGAGPDGAMVQAIDERLKRRFGILAFFAEGLRQFAIYKFPQFRVTTGKGGKGHIASLVVVGRTRNYGGPLSLTPNADLFSDFFEVMVCTSRSRLLYMAYLPLAWMSRIDWAPQTHFFRATSLHCEPLEGQSTWLQADGEPAGRLPAEFEIIPDALSLVVPHG